MKKIDFSIPAALSLSTLSYSGDEDEDMLALPDDEIGEVGLKQEAQEEEEEKKEETEQTEDSKQEEQKENDEDDEEEIEEDETSQITNEDETKKEEEKEEESISPFEKEVLSPLKASGRIVEIRNADHLRALAQMGVDYNKKMEGIKPYIPTLKTLQSKELLDPDAVNMMIALKDGDIDALRKVIAEKGIDPMSLADLDAIEAAKSYQPQDQMIPEETIAVEDALNSIAKSPTYTKTIETLTEVFDEKSRELVSQNPDYIVNLNQDMQTGVAETILSEMEYLETMGKRPAGISDMQFYINVAQSMTPDNEQQAHRQQEQPVHQNTDSKQRDSRRTRMGQSSGSSKPSKKTTFDILSLPDDELEAFEKTLI